MIAPDGGNAEPEGRAPGAQDESPFTARLCPYLLSEAGWRAPTPTGEHRCTALDPPARLAGDKQARLCLVPAHAECATFVAARAARAAQGVPGGTTRRPIARTAPIVVERSRPRIPVDVDAGARRWGQAGLVVLMIMALVAVVVARSGSGPGPGSSSGASATPPDSTASTRSSAGATAAPSTGPSAGSSGGSAGVAPDATTPLDVASAAPSAASGGTYTVQRGDTLSAVAVRFGTTVAALQRANGIRDASLLRVGQVLTIP